MRTLNDAFKGQFKITETEASDPVTTEIMLRLSEKFLVAIKDPAKVGDFTAFYEMVKGCCTPEGFRPSQDLASNIVLDKIKEW